VAMTRRERRLERQIERGFIGGALQWKVSNEHGALAPRAKHPGRARWGGVDGKGKNGGRPYQRNEQVRLDATYTLGYMRKTIKGNGGQWPNG